jgi:hypothetical protein
MSGAWKEDQLTMCRNLIVESVGLCRASETIGIACQDQDRRLLRNTADRIEGRNLIEVGQKEWTDSSQTQLGSVAEQGR